MRAGTIREVPSRIVDFHTGRYWAGARRDIDVDFVNRPSACSPAGAGYGGPAFPLDCLLRRRTAFISALNQNLNALLASCQRSHDGEICDDKHRRDCR